MRRRKTAMKQQERGGRWRNSEFGVGRWFVNYETSRRRRENANRVEIVV